MTSPRTNRSKSDPDNDLLIKWSHCSGVVGISILRSSGLPISSFLYSPKVKKKIYIIDIYLKCFNVYLLVKELVPSNNSVLRKKLKMLVN